MKRKEPASPTRFDTATADDADSESANKKKKKHNDFNGWWKLDLETSDTMVSQNKLQYTTEVAQQPPRTDTTATTDTTNGAPCPSTPLTHQLPCILLSLSSFAGVHVP